MGKAKARGGSRQAAAQRLEATGSAPAKAPQTGAEYLQSLRDGRTVYIYGERVSDVTVHPAFRNTARMVARLYDALHDPKRSSKILLPTDTGNGGTTHAFFKAPKTVDDMLAGRAAIAEWARITYGWLGRSPDYKAAFLATLGANADFYAPYQENARRWYKYSVERVPFINHAIIHPPVDRDRPPSEVVDVCAHVEKETDAGIVVSGAKVVATGSVLTNYTFVAHHGLIPLQDDKFACVFMVPTNAPGVKFICRTSYEMASTAMGSPFDYPLSSRIDENDAVFIMDKVLVPWENVLVPGGMIVPSSKYLSVTTPSRGATTVVLSSWVFASARLARLRTAFASAALISPARTSLVICSSCARCTAISAWRRDCLASITLRALTSTSDWLASACSSAAFARSRSA